MSKGKKTSLAIGLACAIAWQSAHALPKADLVRVHKSKFLLQLLRSNQPFASFRVVFGGNRVGHKQREGDERTPEGRYILDYKKSDSSYYKAIHISYPNAADVDRARKLGVKPGGAIMIHGQPNGLGWLAGITQGWNWTDGCIALRNADMDAVWDSVDVGTPRTQQGLF